MNKFKKIFFFLFISFTIIVIYTIWDNTRVTIVEEDILVEDLPIELEGFMVLQITDLHEKEFGDNQQKLINKINSIQYDVLALTGDYLKSKESENYAATYKILDGIHNKEHVLYVPGNTDPDPYIIKKKTVSKNPFLLGLEKRGVKLLESDFKINNKGASVQFVNFELSIDPLKQSSLPTENKANVLIALSHYPVVDARLDQLMNNPTISLRKFDLILAGHYHGGQIRLPFVGALFVPEAWYERSGLFPPQDRVKGLWQYKNTKQYVSAGLGSSNAIPFLTFRFLNTPEINVLTLKRN
ncbi:metallophosphoesterase [Metabacillus halosaccharovorans]|uniref:metallophosphoesterase n=1 Tax=Metabacillus halosaccharovorans TaxID=930124 RepID=UPI00403D775F